MDLLFDQAFHHCPVQQAELQHMGMRDKGRIDFGVTVRSLANSATRFWHCRLTLPGQERRG